MSLILVVDDSPTERFYLSTALEKAGYSVALAECGSEAIEKAEHLKPNLIIMDVVMPEMNGFQATRAINKNEKTSHIPIVMCTTKGQETDKVWGFRQGAVGYLVKPVAEADLLSMVKERCK